MDNPNFTFIMTVINEDLKTGLDRIYEIQNIYGDYVPILVISDGNIDFPKKIKGVEFLLRDHIKTIKLGGLWTQRYLEIFLSLSNKDYLVKIDPDSKILRPFKFFPPNSDIFGSFGDIFKSIPHKIPYIQGGCIGFSKEGVYKIVSSRYLLDTKYCSNKYTLSYNKKRGLLLTSFQDAILYDVSIRLKLIMTKWSDIAVFPKRLISYYIPGDYSIIHPINLRG